MCNTHPLQSFPFSVHNIQEFPGIGVQSNWIGLYAAQYATLRGGSVPERQVTPVRVGAAAAAGEWGKIRGGNMGTAGRPRFLTGVVLYTRTWARKGVGIDIIVL
jgi:hypothetical protein